MNHLSPVACDACCGVAIQNPLLGASRQGAVGIARSQTSALDLSPVKE